jgi:hypothetical protein
VRSKTYPLAMTTYVLIDSIFEYVSYMIFSSYVVMMSDWYEKAGLVEVVRKVKQHATQHI